MKTIAFISIWFIFAICHLCYGQTQMTDNVRNTVNSKIKKDNREFFKLIPSSSVSNKIDHLVKRLAKILDILSAYFYTRTNELAEIILQYHQYKKQKPNAFLVLSSL